MIDGVLVHPLKQLHDERGKIMHMLRVDAPHFQQFGEVYFSWINPGVIKAWHLHKEMTLNYACPYGLIKLVLFDDRKNSATHGEIMELFLGPDTYTLVIVPPGIWNGFKGVANHPSLVCNCATVPHRADELERLDPFSQEIAYDWGLRHG
jgi:dTDP-4-dehydrorhamnose 3,5-epimerase